MRYLFSNHILKQNHKVDICGHDPILHRKQIRSRCHMQKYYKCNIFNISRTWKWEKRGSVNERVHPRTQNTEVFSHTFRNLDPLLLVLMPFQAPGRFCNSTSHGITIRRGFTFYDRLLEHFYPILNNVPPPLKLQHRRSFLPSCNLSFKLICQSYSYTLYLLPPS